MARGFVSISALALLWPVAAQAQPATTGPAGPGGRDQPPAANPFGEPRASGGGTARLSEPRPVSETEDPLNRHVAAETLDGLVATLTIDGPTVTLDSATLARIPRGAVRANRRDFGEGGSVKVTAFAGSRQVGQAEVPDNVLRVQEGSGIVRATRRQLSIPVAIGEGVDRITVEAPMTGASATLDLRAALKRWCDGGQRNKWCPPAR